MPRFLYIPNMVEKVHKFMEPFVQQYEAVSKALIEATEEYPIALCALYGSMLKGVRPCSDIDILVLLRDDYHNYGSILDIRDALCDIVECKRSNNIKIDLMVRSVSSFLDISRGTEFKRSFCQHNEIFWEDGVSVRRELIKEVEAV